MPATCPVCNTTRLVRQYQDIGVCASCCRRGVQSAGRPELRLRDFLLGPGGANLPRFLHNRTDPRTRSETTRCRLDFRAVCDGYDIGLEVDEGQHRYNGALSELVRLQALVQAAGGRPLMLFRVNPDAFHNRAGATRVYTRAAYTQALDERFTLLAERVQARVQKTERRRNAARSVYTPPLLYVEKLFFDTDSQDPRYQEVTVRQYKDAAAIQAEITRTVRAVWAAFFNGVHVRC